MKMYIKILSFFLSILLLSSCSSDGGKTGISKQSGGTALGAIAGGLLGAQFGGGEGKFLAAGAGAILGGLIGNQIGKSMDDTDKLMAERTSQQALETAPAGKATTWKNPDSGNSGTITPIKTYKSQEGRYCREYTQQIKVGDQIEKAYGTACRQPDGQWQIISQ